MVRLPSAHWCQTPPLQPQCETPGELFTLFVSAPFHLTGGGSAADTQRLKVLLDQRCFFFFLTETTSELQWSKLNATVGGAYFFYYLFASSGCTLRWKKCLEYKFPMETFFLFFFHLLPVYTCRGGRSSRRFLQSVPTLPRRHPQSSRTGVRLITIWWLWGDKAAALQVENWLSALCAGAIIRSWLCSMFQGKLSCHQR